ncbi:MAG: hypothetical protein JWN10_146 [Solirubrobacterales bacterium]|nr:hypothetical protein [Solirubrobacterales bacterium]
MSLPDEDVRARWALTAARCAGEVSNFCDHAVHNEFTDREWVLGSAHALRGLACEIAAELDEDLLARYAARLSAIERRNPLWAADAPDGAALASRASTWRELQLVQAAHDHHYHPDVIGNSKLEQLHHYALHVSKLAGACAELAQAEHTVEDFRARRLPDLLLFGIKLSTALGQALPDRPLTGDPAVRALTAA